MSYIKAIQLGKVWSNANGYPLWLTDMFAFGVFLEKHLDVYWSRQTYLTCVHCEQKALF